MQKIVEKAILNSYTYNEYRALIETLLKENKVTGFTQNEHLVHYTELNETRMNRLDKTLKVTDDVKEGLQAITKNITWLTISEGWCGDAAQIVPMLNKMAEVSDNIEFKIVLRDENEELMNLFLTNGGKAIPKVIIIDEDNYEVIGSWGPRPADAKKLIEDYKAAHGVIDETIKVELQKWYLKDKGESTQKELLAAMEEKILA